MLRLDISLPGQTYPLFFGRDLLTGAAFSEIAAFRKAAIVSDETVWALHGERLTRALSARGIVFTSTVIPPGEQSKSLARVERLYHAFHQFGLQRTDAVIAFGGGVVGDLAGFAAATYLRGVKFLQIPTTLLAQADAGVGGKVAVNLPEGKNLVGSFYQPVAVLADTAVLASLPAREWQAGMAEVIKYAALGERELYTLLSGGQAFSGALERTVYLCCRCKAGYVEQDERDTGARMMLNFGHTFGHAIEKYYGFERYNHGEAVARGMMLAARTGEALGVSEAGTARKLQVLLELCGVGWRLDGDVAALIPLMSSDKKNSGAELSLVLLKRMGEPFLYRVSHERLNEVWRGMLNE